MQVSMHVLCVTPNVSIDRTLVVPGFSEGGVWRAADVSAVCGGKGVNVARAVVALGHRATCAGMLAGHTGRLAAELAAAEGLRAAWTWTPGETRTCVIIVGSEGAATVINEPGCAISAAHWDRFVCDVAMAARTANAICISGSLPPGTPRDALRVLIERTGRGGCPVWMDTSGAALVEAMGTALSGAEIGTRVGIKVNAEEAATLVGQPVVSPESAAVAAETIQQRGTSRVVITLGAAGAVLVSDGIRLWARPPAIAAVNAVGSGDCFLAGLVAGWHEHGSPEEALRLATAAGAANALRTTVGVSAADVANLLAKTTLTPLL
jgi:1-phosphofructokinase family hexose kinase